MAFGERLKKLREDNDLTRDELASKLNISYSTIAKYETNVRFPDQDMLSKIASLFNVTADFLLARSDIRNPYQDDPDAFTQDELDLLKKIQADPDISILFHDLKSAPKRKIKQLLKTWEFINEQFNEMDEEE